MRIIGISGKAEHGKTFTCNVLKKRFEKQGLKVDIIPLASWLKEYAKKVDWDGEKDIKGRTLLQELGPVLKHYHGGDCFARWSYEQAVKENLDILLIDDMRLLDEVEFYDSIKDKVDDYKLIRVTRPNYENRLTAEQRQDLSEIELDNYNFEISLINDGTSNFIKIINDKI